ncbi:histidine phosphatase family protein [Candidatus Protochlamydia phocaeensis]|uniref:histidine phosphatase family protein n=1 Tax=Candidatus Protochlamydia phocaeensis TaxID=1414722 RepID=UPI000838E530|nr:histidine phosphatase family protein [Candidatus Protochlamydia phocaeensis]
MSQESCEVYIVRHGETDWNAAGRLQGHTDIPLNAQGMLQAQSLKQVLSHISFKAAFSSDLSRAKETAKCIIDPHPIPLFESSELRERHAGSFEGKSFKEVDNLMRQFFISRPGASSQEEYLNSVWHPEVETWSSVFCRVKNYLLSHVHPYTGQAILVVSHGGVIRSVLDHVNFIPKNKWVISNCGYIKLKIGQQLFALEETVGVLSKPLF